MLKLASFGYGPLRCRRFRAPAKSTLCLEPSGGKSRVKFTIGRPILHLHLHLPPSLRRPFLPCRLGGQEEAAVFPLATRPAPFRTAPRLPSASPQRAARRPSPPAYPESTKGTAWTRKWLATSGSFRSAGRSRDPNRSEDGNPRRRHRHHHHPRQGRNASSWFTAAARFRPLEAAAPPMTPPWKQGVSRTMTTRTRRRRRRQRRARARDQRWTT
jgi:hypothetical protein